MRSLSHLILPLALSVLMVTCRAPLADEESDAVSVVEKPLATLGMDRAIPIRIVQISASSSSFMNDADLRKQIEGTNSVYKAAGLQFYVVAQHNVVDATFANPSTTAPYNWPNPVSTATPIVFNPTCSFSHPTTEPNTAQALWRAAFLCGFDGEVLVYILDNYVTNTGAFPINGKGILLIRSNLANPPYVFAHEMGHYLGLGHVFDGALIDPETLANSQAAAWDLVYLPRSVSSPFSAANKVFATRADAAAYEGSLLPIRQGASPSNCAFCNPGQPGNPCPAQYAEGTLRCVVPTGLSSPATETWFTGESRMRGIGFTVATTDPGGGTDRAFNVMDYPPPATGTPSHPYLFSISESQILQIRRQLRFEVVNSHPDPTLSGIPSGRPRLGLASATPRLTERMNVDNVGGRDLTIYEPYSGKFKVKPSGSSNAFTGTTISATLGGSGDFPMPGDYDGDGKVDYAVKTFSIAAGSVRDAFIRWCPSSVTVNQGSNKCSRIEKMPYGYRDDITMSDVDFDGDPATPEIAAYRPSTSEWFFGSIPKPLASAPAGEFTVQSTSVGYFQFPGGPTAEPTLGLYDSDNKTDIVMYDAPSHLFALRLSTENYQTIRLINLPTPGGASWPLVVRGLKRASTGRLAVAAWYPGSNVRIVWNPASLPASWNWGDSGASTTSCATTTDSVPVSGAIDLNNDGVSDIVQYFRNSGGTTGRFVVVPIGTALTCQTAVNIDVSNTGEALKLVPFIVGDMKGDGRNELGVVNPDTQTWRFFPSDGGFSSSNSFTFQFGSRDAQPL